MVDFLKKEEIREDSFLQQYPEVEEVIETGVARHDPMNPAPMIELLSRYNKEIDMLVDRAMEIKVVDDASCEVATSMTTQAKKIASTIKKKKDELKRPYLDVSQALDRFTKTIVDRLDNLQKGVNKKIAPYLQQVEMRRREAERKAQEEARELQKKLDKEAEAAGEEAPVVVAEIPDEVKVQTDSGTAKIKEVWSFEIIDPKSMPADAFENRKEQVISALSPWVRAQVSVGIRKIEGVKIFKETRLDTRATVGMKAGSFKFQLTN